MEPGVGAVIRSIEKEFASVERELRYSAEPISGKEVEPVGFIDGSVSLNERRGAFIVILSAASIIYSMHKYLPALPGSKKPFLHILMPKSYGESRSAILMRTLENLEALRQIYAGVRVVCLDGSYLTLLLTGYSYMHEIYNEFSKSYREALKDVLEVLANESNEYLEQLSALVKMIDRGGLRELYQAYRDILFNTTLRVNKVVQNLEENYGRENIKPVLIDYVSSYLELTPFFYISSLLLETAKREDASIVWISKESNSRFLANIYELRGWVTDLVLVDWAWSGLDAAYFVFDDTKPVSIPKYHVAPQKVIGDLYRWNHYVVVYAKLAKYAPSLQISYPKGLVEEDILNDLLYTLSKISDKRTGYPKPLNYVHNLAVLSLDTAKLVAEKIWRNSRGLQRSLLAPAGREQLGLR